MTSKAGVGVHCSAPRISVCYAEGTAKGNYRNIKERKPLGLLPKGPQHFLAMGNLHLQPDISLLFSLASKMKPESLIHGKLKNKYVF